MQPDRKRDLGNIPDWEFKIVKPGANLLLYDSQNNDCPWGECWLEGTWWSFLGFWDILSLWVVAPWVHMYIKIHWAVLKVGAFCLFNLNKNRDKHSTLYKFIKSPHCTPWTYTMLYVNHISVMIGGKINQKYSINQIS